MVLIALSFQGQVEKYGVYVGIAAFFGLAVLSLLYFAQARELKRLREWAGRAPERARELEERVVAEAEAAAAAARPGTVTAGATIAPSRRLAEMPAAPAAGAQAAGGAQATEVVDDKAAEAASNGNAPAAPAPPAGEAAGTGNGAAPPAEGGEADAEDVSAERPEDEVIEETVAPGDAPAAVAAGETGEAPAGADTEAGADAVPPDAPATPAPSEAGDEQPATVAGADAETAIPAAADESAEREPAVTAAAGEASATAGGVSPPVPRMTPAQRVGVTPRPAPMPLRQSRASATPADPAGPRRPPVAAARRPAAAPRQGRSAGTIALFVGLAVLILGGGTFLVSQLGGEDSPPPPNRAAPAPGADGTTQATTPAETNVAVLNGTTFTGLAGQLADRISQEGGFERGATETNTRDQTLQSSTVYFEDGSRAEAREVARLLSIAALEPIDEETRSLAPDADVVVLAGADQAP